MDVLDPAVHPSPSRNPSSPRLGVAVAPDGGPVRFSVRRMSSSASGSHSLARMDREEIREREQLVNEYEAEEERLVNVLGRRMEELKNENTTLHNTMEGESEAVVNRLQRQLQSLQAEIAALKKTPSSSTSSSMPVLPGDEAVLPPAAKLDALAAGGDPLVPSEERVLEALKRENEALRSKLADAERGFIHVSRLNDVYRDELLTHRTRLNLSTTDLTNPSSSSTSSSPSISSSIPNLFSLPLHRRTSSSTSGTRASRSPGPIINNGTGTGGRRGPGAPSASPSPMEVDTGGGGAERRTSFGAVQTGGLGSGGRVAERGQLRRMDSAGSSGAGAGGTIEEGR